MEDKEGYKEGIESYRQRLITEITNLNFSVDRLVDSRNTNYALRSIARSIRTSLEKCNLYIGYIEEIVEKRIKDDEMARQAVKGDSEITNNSRQDTSK